MAGLPKTAVLGLGNMGAAVADCLIGAGGPVTVWNRTAAKAAAFAGRCSVASDARTAVQSSDVIVSVLPDYDTAREVLGDLGSELSGKTVLQLSSGTPDEARELSASVIAAGAGYLDGKIFTYPARVGAPMTRFAYSGSSAAYDLWIPLGSALGGRSTFFGDDPGAAATVDLGWLSFLYGASVGLFQAVAYCRAEGVDAAAVFDSVPSWLSEIDAESSYYDFLHSRRDYSGDQATLEVHLAAMSHLAEAARSRDISAALPDLLLQVFGRAIELGHGSDELAAGIDALVHP